MKQKMLGLMTAVVFAASCGFAADAASPPETFDRSHQNTDYKYDPNGNGMKDLFGPYFRIGTSTSAYQIKDTAYQEFVKKHFNSVTCENELKPDAIIKNIDGTDVTVDLKSADPILKFAEQNEIGVRGFTFLWYSQTPAKMFEGTPEEADLRMQNFIRETFTQLKTNYPNLKLYAYDVAAELFKNEGGGLRTAFGNSSGYDYSRWADVYGEDNDAFIINAFKTARENAPQGCKLLLSDYNEYMPEKTDDIYNLAKRIMQQGNYIDGISMQSHLSADYPDQTTYENAVKKLVSLGLDIQITELDVINNHKSSDQQMLQQLKDVFRIALKYEDRISSVTLWNPQGNSYHFYTLFQNNQPKDAYDELISDVFRSELPSTATGTLPEIRLGDANCDGGIDIADAVLVMRYSSEDQEAVITDQGLLNSDTDGDGRVRNNDAVLILQHIAKKITLPL